MSEPLEPKLFEHGLGLATLKTEGGKIPFDGEVRLPLTFWGRVRRKLFQISRRLRYAPRRVWWALFGDEYY